MMEATISTHSCSALPVRRRHVPARAGASRSGLAINPAHQPHILAVSSKRPQHRVHAVAEGKQVGQEKPPPPLEVSTSIQTVQLDGSIKLFQCFCNSSLRYEAEYARKRGTTTNTYMLSDGDQSVLIDVPRAAYLETFCKELAKETNTISTIVITHLNPDIVDTLAKVLTVVKCPTDGITLVMSNPAKQVLVQKLGDDSDALDNVTIRTVKGGDTIELGRRTVQCISAATPRYPELLCLYERGTRKLFSSCLFSAHVNPQKGVVGTDGSDLGGWEAYSSDWQFFFDCMFAPVARQTSAAITKLDLRVSRKRAQKGQTFGTWLKNLFGSGDTAPKAGVRPVAMILPRHGPIARQSVTQLVNAYIEWTDTQLKRMENAKVAVLYASAYGNTAALAQAISRGITKAGVGAEMVNLEQVTTDEAQEVLKSSQGFVIGSPTLGGHMPTQVSAMLGSILRLQNAKALPCGVYGSFGWSGEAVDLMQDRLTDAGFQTAFKPIRVQFRPDAKAMQLCEESGTDLAQNILKSKKKSQKSGEKRANSMTSSQVSGAAQAMGRVVGSLSVVTVKDENAETAMLASWLSQASFDPPGLTVSVKQDRAAESLLAVGNPFNVNILEQGQEGPVMKALLKKFEPGEDRFTDVAHTRSAETGCVVLDDAVSVLECTVADRMDAGDHYIVFGTVRAGKVLNNGLSAVHHRKSGTGY